MVILQHILQLRQQGHTTTFTANREDFPLGNLQVSKELHICQLPIERLNHGVCQGMNMWD
jgi:hypothetical protein